MRALLATIVLLLVPSLCAAADPKPVSDFVQELKDVGQQLEANAPIVQRQQREKDLADAVLAKHKDGVFTVSTKVVSAKFSYRDNRTHAEYHLITIEQPPAWLASAPTGSHAAETIKLPLSAAQFKNIKKGDTLTMNGKLYAAKVQAANAPQTVGVCLGQIVLPESQAKLLLFMMTSSWTIMH